MSVRFGYICTSMKKLLLALTVFYVNTAVSQVSVKDSSIAAPVIGFSYAYQIPFGDMAERFNPNNSLGLDLLYKTKKNFLFGAEGRFIFSEEPKQKGILDSIATSNSLIISNDGYPAVVKLFERGFSVMAKAGKIFPIWPNENSGFLVTVSAGFLQHKIRIEDISERAPQITKEMIKGYDRLSNGPCVGTSAGYFFMGNKKYLNFFAVAELYYGATKSRRGYNYDLMAPDTEQRSDILTGLRFGLMIPFYKKVPDQFYYY